MRAGAEQSSQAKIFQRPLGSEDVPVWSALLHCVLENFYLWTHVWVMLHLLTVALQREQQERAGKSCWFGTGIVLISSAPGLYSGKDLWRRKEDPF